MKSVKGTINEALAQVANHNKELRPVVEAPTATLDEKLDDSDKERITELRERIKDLEEQQQRLRDQISQIKRSAGVDVQ